MTPNPGVEPVKQSEEKRRNTPCHPLVKPMTKQALYIPAGHQFFRQSHQQEQNQRLPCALQYRRGKSHFNDPGSPKHKDHQHYYADQRHTKPGPFGKSHPSISLPQAEFPPPTPLKQPIHGENRQDESNILPGEAKVRIADVQHKRHRKNSCQTHQQQQLPYKFQYFYYNRLPRSPNFRENRNFPVAYGNTMMRHLQTTF